MLVYSEAESISGSEFDNWTTSPVSRRRLEHKAKGINARPTNYAAKFPKDFIVAELSPKPRIAATKAILIIAVAFVIRIVRGTFAPPLIKENTRSI
ncbi:hypothetical protein BOTNAR_0264g00020 [Botryotinia narcissicola]|uniref:Uncharacterized protein n=1 Tax=Botryotinia narcissicola TaxID=278944 RepID=A0A4Z1HZS6_9HELO|nr:hypothetical protein BOTNAR_0264g00020 [Botryotinia narcissicola]